MFIGYESLSPNSLEKEKEYIFMENGKDTIESATKSAADLVLSASETKSLVENYSAGVIKDNELLKVQIESLSKDNERLKDILKIVGNPNPNTNRSNNYPAINPYYPPELKARGGLIAESESMSKNATPYMSVGQSGRQKFFDNAEFDLFVKENYSGLMKEFTPALKNKGYIGGKIQYGQETPTERGDIIPAFLDVIAAKARVTKTNDKIMWQFTNMVTDLGKMPGDFVRVWRTAYLTPPNRTDRKLTPGTLLNATRQSLGISSVNIEIEEFGLGKDNSNGLIDIPDFYMNNTAISLEDAVQRVLINDYHTWEDNAIMGEFLVSVNIRYSNSGSLQTAQPAHTAANTMSANVVSSMASEMAANGVPTIDGNYICVMGWEDLDNFNQTINADYNYSSTVDGLDKMFSAPVTAQVDRVSGFVGRYNNVLLFVSNNIPTITIGNTYNQAMFFGGQPVGYGIGMPMQLRMDTTGGNMQRDMLFGWYAHAGILETDVSAGPQGQQDFVYIVRTFNS